MVRILFLVVLLTVVSGDAYPEKAIKYAPDKNFDEIKSLHFIVKFEKSPGMELLAEDVMEISEQAYSKVGWDLDHQVKTVSTVIIYSSIKQFKDVTSSADWAGGYFDGRIHLPISGKFNREKLRKFIFHEYTHLVSQEIVRGNCPFWLFEGVADCEAENWDSEKERILLYAAQNNFLFPLSELEKGFSHVSKGKAKLCYNQSYSATTYLIKKIGFWGLKDFFRDLGKGIPFDRILKKMAGVDMDEFEREWKSSLLK